VPDLEVVSPLVSVKYSNHCASKEKDSEVHTEEIGRQKTG